MLSELVVEGLGPIERAEISFDGGSSALTGETGTGKTLVVAAVGLLLGDRADKTLIREGGEAALIEGRFVVDGAAPVVRTLTARDLLGPDAPSASEVEIVVSRVVSPSSSKARLNGRLVPASVLTEMAPSLVEIAGQQEHQRLGSRGHQRLLLDAFAGTDAVELAGRVRDGVRAAARARAALEEAIAGERDAARELDALRSEIAEIASAKLEVGEIARLSEAASALENAESNAASLATAIDALRGERGADELLR
ncbi:MAG: AAA family ATPase, partial [Actinomycetota bacterium]|nr:AAA family ATPase [Actinomycetota bacterium]